MLSSPETIEKQLSEAQARLKAVVTVLASKHKGGEWEEFRAAQDDLLRLEREVAKAHGWPYAIPCDFPVKWDAGAPLPFLLRNDCRTFLTFCIRKPAIDPLSSNKVSLCLVSFDHCTSAKLGHPNDEAQGGHPLYGRGLRGYTAQIVMNSPWIKEVAKTNSIHPNDNPKTWSTLNHYVFWFHDSTFECLAKSYKVEVTSETMSELLNRVQAKLLA